ncbi:hypothetical protein BZA70DRAFT_269489 [Myxozyma melibiosi]|uniref:Transmembrane protein n=1 Tax=Myxozyma melibiosi TaxID=54550 RepID=A0ABR1EZ38_9ASCO
MRFRFKLTPTNLNLSFSPDPQDVAGSVHFNVLQTPQRLEFQFMHDSNVSFSSSTVPNAEVDSDYYDTTYDDHNFPPSSYEVLTDDSISEETTGQPDTSESTTSNEYRASYGSTYVGHSDNLETIDSTQPITQAEAEPQNATGSDDLGSPSEQSANENDDPAELEPATLATATPPSADFPVRQPSPENGSRTLTAREIILAMIGHYSVTRDASFGNGTQALTPGQAAGRVVLDLIQPSRLTPGQTAGRLILDLIKPKSSINHGTLDVVKNRVSSVSSDPAIVSFARAPKTESVQPAGSSSALTQENDSSSEILIQKHRSVSAPNRPSVPVRRFNRFSSFAGICTEPLDYFVCKKPHCAQTHRAAAAESQPPEIQVLYPLKSSERKKKSYGEIKQSVATTTTEEDSTAQPEFDLRSHLPIDHVHSLVQKFEAQQATIPDPKFLHSKFYRSRASSRSVWSGTRGNVVEGHSQTASEPIESEKADEPEPVVDGPSETIQEGNISGSATVSTGMRLVLRHEVCMIHLLYPRPLKSPPPQIQPRVVVPDHMDNTAPVFRRMVLPGRVPLVLQSPIRSFISRELALLFRGTPGLLAPPELSALVLYRSSSTQTPPALLPAHEPVSDRQLVLYRQGTFEAGLPSSPEPVRDRGFVLYRALTMKQGLLALPAPVHLSLRSRFAKRASALIMHARYACCEILAFVFVYSVAALAFSAHLAPTVLRYTGQTVSSAWGVILAIFISFRGEFRYQLELSKQKKQAALDCRSLVIYRPPPASFSSIVIPYVTALGSLCVRGGRVSKAVAISMVSSLSGFVDLSFKAVLVVIIILLAGLARGLQRSFQLVRVSTTAQREQSLQTVQSEHKQIFSDETSETHDRELEQEKSIAAAAPPTTGGASHIDARPSLTLTTELAISSMKDSSPATESSSLELSPFSSPSLPASSPASSVPSPDTVLEKPEPFSQYGTEEVAHDDEVDYEMDYSPAIPDEIEYRGEGDSSIHTNCPSDWYFPDYEQVLDGADGSHYQISDMEPCLSIFLIDESTIPW